MRGERGNVPALMERCSPGDEMASRDAIEMLEERGGKK
jgi:hypothetical protein